MTDTKPKLTVELVRELVSTVDSVRGDDEVAHSSEDDLHQTVLRAIAEGACDDPVACAREALKTLDIQFSRWCA